MTASTAASPLKAALLPVAAALTFGLFHATAADARSAAPYYTAELAQPAAKPMMIVAGAPFRCAGTSCTGVENSASTRTVCAKLRQEAGTLVAFTARGKAFDADKLAACNG